MRDRSLTLPLSLLLTAATFAGVAVRAWGPLANPDTYFHLRIGDEVLSGRWSLSHPGHFSPTSTHGWVSTQWLGQVAMAAAERIAGLDGVAWLSALVAMSFLLALWWSARQWAGAPIAAALVVMGYLATPAFLTARPQVWSYLFVVVTVVAWLRTAEDGRARWWLVPLTWAWSMLHGMWPVGLVLGMAAVAGLALDHGVRRMQLLAIPLASLAVTLLTPMGPRLPRELMLVAHQREFFAEWASPELASWQALPALALLGALVVGQYLHRTTWTVAALTVVAVLWLISAGRTQPVAVAIFVPLIARTWGPTLPQEAEHRRSDVRLVAGLAAVTLTILGVVLSVVPREQPDQVRDLDAVLQDVPAGSRVLSDWGWGGYLAWARPDLEPTMHGYGDMFTHDELRRNHAVTRLDPGWRDTVAAHGAEMAVLERHDRLTAALLNDGWTKKATSGNWVLLTPP